MPTPRWELFLLRPMGESAQKPSFLVLPPGRLFLLRKRRREQKLYLPKGLVGQVSLRPESRPRLAGAGSWWVGVGGIRPWPATSCGGLLVRVTLGRK